ncbi:magnesium transporter CorA [Streptomyces purpurascens]
MVPLSRPLEDLATRPIRAVDPEIQAYFRDVSDHLLRAKEQIASFDELLNSILQAHLAQVTVAQNEDMRKITAWAAIIAVPTMVCGVYGMNFEHMPELHWRYGYGMVIGVISVACVTLYRAFRRSGWL